MNSYDPNESMPDFCKRMNLNHEVDLMPWQKQALEDARFKKMWRKAGSTMNPMFKRTSSPDLADSLATSIGLQGLHGSVPPEFIFDECVGLPDHIWNYWSLRHPNLYQARYTFLFTLIVILVTIAEWMRYAS